MEINMSTAGGTWHPSIWYYHLRRSLKRWDVTPTQITGIYLVLGFLALYFSDVFLVRTIDNPTTLSQLQAVKGGVEVLLTGGLIFVLVRRSRRAIGRTNDRLERQQQELQVMHRVLRHNLRNDITLITGYGTSLLEDLEDDRHRRWCEAIVDVAKRINHYTDQTRKINRVDTTDTLATINLVAVVRRLVGDRPALERAVSLEAPDGARVHAHPMLKGAIDELLTNAVTHTEREDPRVTVTVDPDAGPPHRTTLEVRDNGPGIPSHVRRTIEQRGETPLIHLDGLGLWLVSWVVTVSNGEFEIENPDTGGTRVTLQLPKANAGPPSMPSIRMLVDRLP